MTYLPRKPEAPKTVATIPLKDDLPPRPRLKLLCLFEPVKAGVWDSKPANEGDRIVIHHLTAKKDPNSFSLEHESTCSLSTFQWKFINLGLLFI